MFNFHNFGSLICINISDISVKVIVVRVVYQKYEGNIKLKKMNEYIDHLLNFHWK